MAQDVITKKIKHTPRYAKGAGVSELVRKSSITVKSNPIDSTDTTAINVFELPENVLVVSANVRVTTAFDPSGNTTTGATATITIPGDTGTITLFDAGVTPSLLESTGIKPSTAQGITASSGGMLILNYTPGTTTAGQLEVYLTYIDYADEL